MRLTCDAKDLGEAARIAMRAVHGKPPIPIFHHLRIDARGRTPTINGASYELQIEAGLDGTIEASGAATCLAKPLEALCRVLGTGAICLEADDEGAMLRITQGSEEYELLGLPVSEFPDFPTIDPLTRIHLPLSEMQRTETQVCFSASHDASRPQLTGLHLRSEGEMLWMECGAMARLAMLRLNPEEVVVAGEPLDCILPIRAFLEAIAASKKQPGNRGVVMGFRTAFTPEKTEANPNPSTQSGAALIEIGPLRFHSRLIEGKFPNFSKVLPIPKDRIALQRDDLMAAIQRARAVLGTGATDGQRVRFKHDPEGLHFSAEGLGIGRAHRLLPFTGSMGDYGFSLDGGLLLDYLRRIDAPEIEMGFPEGLDKTLAPIAFRPAPIAEGQLYVQMPLMNS